MSYGLRVKNTSGDIIIDENYRNFAFYVSGSATATVSCPGGWCYGVLTLVPFTAIPNTQIPLVAIQPATNKFINLLGYHKTGSNWDGFYIVTGIADDGNWESCTINYKVFVAGLAAAPGAYGMRVYNASSQIIFDSNRSYFKIGQVNSISLSSPAYPSYTYYYQDVSHPSYSNPYYFLSPVGYHHGTSCAGAWIFRIGLKKLSSTSVRVGWNQVFQSEPEGVDATYNPASKLIVLV